MLRSILQILPGIATLVAKLIGSKNAPPKRADEILGEADEPTDSEKAQDAARKRAREKYGR